MALSLVIEDVGVPVSAWPVQPPYGDVDITVARCFASEVHTVNLATNMASAAYPSNVVKIGMRATHNDSARDPIGQPNNAALTYMPYQAFEFGYMLDTTFNPLYRRVAAVNFIQTGNVISPGVPIGAYPSLFTVEDGEACYGMLVARVTFGTVSDRNANVAVLAGSSLGATFTVDVPLGIRALNDTCTYTSAPFLLFANVGQINMITLMEPALVRGTLAATNGLGDGGRLQLQLYIVGGFFPPGLAAGRTDIVA